jgi:hypothetical protein
MSNTLGVVLAEITARLLLPGSLLVLYCGRTCWLALLM